MTAPQPGHVSANPARLQERRHAPEVPRPVRAALEELGRRGHRAWLVGEPLAALIAASEQATPRHYEASTTARLDEVLSCFSHAVPTQRAQNIATVPTAAGPIDCVPLRNGPDVVDDLAHRGFTIHALAWDPVSEDLIDPWGGVADLRAHRLRSVGAASERIAEEPLRALRVARLIAERGLRPDPALALAAHASTAKLKKLSPLRVRAELRRIVLGANAESAIRWLREAGIESCWVPKARADSAALVASLPSDLPLRLAAWLRDTPAAKILRRLRMGPALSAQVLELLEHHPADRVLLQLRESALQRLVQRVGPHGITQLFELRRRELSLESGEKSENDASDVALRRVEERIEALRARAALIEARHSLALDGESVMEILGCNPGREVGVALAYLTEQISIDPSRNTPESLRALLLDWARELPSQP